MSGRPQHAIDAPDLAEKGRTPDGAVTRSDRRLFVQFQAFTDCHDTDAVIEAVRSAGIEAVLYANASDPRGIGLVTCSEQPSFFVDTLRPLLLSAPFAACTPQPEYTMFGRTYSIGYEPDLNEVLLNRPRRHFLNPEWPWAVWYPLRRKGEFEQLTPDQKRQILGEHAAIGMAYGRSNLAHDIRLACHGMDKHDNDFVVGLVGNELFPLSAVVQKMRETVQTSQYLDRLGPFFIGHAVYQSSFQETATPET